MIATEGKQKDYLNEWSLCCSLLVLKIGVRTGLFICNLRPNILHEAVDNLEARSELDKLTDACSGCRVRK
jgi:hypothetical protein